jgi:hypothetical protein
MSDENTEEDEQDELGEDDWENEGGAGVREPRRNPPSRTGGAAKAKPEPESELVGAATFSASWFY